MREAEAKARFSAHLRKAKSAALQLLLHPHFKHPVATYPSLAHTHSGHLRSTPHENVSHDPHSPAPQNPKLPPPPHPTHSQQTPRGLHHPKHPALTHNNDRETHIPFPPPTLLLLFSRVRGQLQRDPIREPGLRGYPGSRLHRLRHDVRGRLHRRMHGHRVYLVRHGLHLQLDLAPLRNHLR